MEQLISVTTISRSITALDATTNRQKFYCLLHL